MFTVAVESNGVRPWLLMAVIAPVVAAVGLLVMVTVLLLIEVVIVPTGWAIRYALMIPNTPSVVVANVALVKVLNDRLSLICWFMKMQRGLVTVETYDDNGLPFPQFDMVLPVTRDEPPMSLPLSMAAIVVPAPIKTIPSFTLLIVLP